jgi:hypothetical protein
MKKSHLEGESAAVVLVAVFVAGLAVSWAAATRGIDTAHARARTMLIDFEKRAYMN